MYPHQHPNEHRLPLFVLAGADPPGGATLVLIPGGARVIQKPGRLLAKPFQVGLELFFPLAGDGYALVRLLSPRIVADEFHLPVGQNVFNVAGFPLELSVKL